MRPGEFLPGSYNRGKDMAGNIRGRRGSRADRDSDRKSEVCGKSFGFVRQVADQRVGGIVDEREVGKAEIA